MEQREIFKLKLQTFQKALKGFEDSLNIDLSKFEDVVVDAIKNGRIQKFEYCTELTWKLINKYENLIHGIDARSPKQTVKEFFLLDVIDEKTYELLLNILDDRNRLSHIYREECFEEISKKLPEYFKIMKKVLKIISKFD